MSGWRHSVRKECCALSSSNRVCLNARLLLQASSCPASGLVLGKGGAQATLALLCSALRGGAPARCLATHKCHKCALAVWQSKASIVVLRAEELHENSRQRSPTLKTSPISSLYALLWPFWWPVLALCRQQVSLPEWLKGGLKIPLHATLHCSNPIADMSGRRHSVRKECFALSSSSRVCLNVSKCHKCALAVWQSKASIVVLRAEQRSPTRILGSAAPQSKLLRSLISTLCFEQADDQCWRSAGSKSVCASG